MSRLARVSFIFLLIAMLGLIACERSKADVVDTTPTTETALGTGQDGGEGEPSGEDGEDFGISTATPEATEPAETAEPGPTTVTIGEGEGEADQPTATPEEGAQAGATATPSDGEGEETAAPTATSEPEPTTAPTTTEERIHVVQRGEWVYSIARQYPGVSPQDIIDANNLQYPNTVYVGQELTIPGTSGDSGDSDDSGGQRTHVVQRGETLTGIARQYDTTVSALRSANNLSSDRIYAGQTLTIP